jgi:4'-phosphopantetheinyl transferase
MHGLAGNEQQIPSGNSVHVWTISLAEPVSNILSLDLPELLSNEEIARLGRIHNQKAQSDFLRSRVALRLILSSYLSCPAADISFSYNNNGKPELAPAGSDSIRFNLSHSGDCCLLAVTRGCDIGVDIERYRTGRDYEALARRFFTAGEQLILESDMGEQLFYSMWVLKEASIKARGMKLLEGLDRFECILTPDGALDIVDKLKQGDRDNWSIKLWQADDHSVAALVARCTEAKIIEKRLNDSL